MTYDPSLRSHLDSVVAAYTLGLLYGCTPKLLAAVVRVVRGKEQASIALRKVLSSFTSHTGPQHRDPGLERSL